MPGREQAIHAYYQILFELLIFVAFVIVLKIVMLILMARLSAILSDDPEKARQERTVRKQRTTFDQTSGQKWLRLGMGLLLTLSGLLQIQPRMVSIPSSTLIHDFGWSYAPATLRSMVDPFAHLWVTHSAWMNVFACGIQLLVGLILLTTSNKIATWICAGVAAALGIYDFVGMTGFGGLFTSSASVLGAAPVRGLVYSLLSLLFFVPTRSWQTGKLYRPVQIGVLVYWILGVLLQLLPTEGFWSETGWNRILQLGVHTNAPQWVLSFSSGIGHAVDPAAAVFNVVSIVLMAVWAVGLWLKRGSSAARVLQILSMGWLVLSWVLFSHFGFQTVYLFPLGTGPAIILALLLMWVEDRKNEISHPSSLRSGAGNESERVVGM